MNNMLSNPDTLDPQVPGQGQVTIGDGGGSADASTGITRADLDAILAELKQVKEEQARTRQSLGDRDKSLRREIDDKIAKLEKARADLGLTDEEYKREAAKIRSDATARYLNEDGEPAQGDPSNSSPTKADVTPEDAEKLSLAVAEIHVKAGIALTPADPEFTELGQIEAAGKLGLEEFVVAYRSQVEKKAKRLGKQISLPAGDPGARVPGPGGGQGSNNPIENIIDPRTLFEKGLAKLGQGR